MGHTGADPGMCVPCTVHPPAAASSNASARGYPHGFCQVGPPGAVGLGASLWTARRAMTRRNDGCTARARAAADPLMDQLSRSARVPHSPWRLTGSIHVTGVRPAGRVQRPAGQLGLGNVTDAPEVGWRVAGGGWNLVTKWLVRLLGASHASLHSDIGVGRGRARQRLVPRAALDRGAPPHPSQKQLRLHAVPRPPCPPPSGLVYPIPLARGASSAALKPCLTASGREAPLLAGDLAPATIGRGVPRPVAAGS
jgi:hypothetical protein